MNKQISKRTLNRLPIYLSLLQEKANEGVEYISATTIANLLDLNHVQVRKDLSCASFDQGSNMLVYEECNYHGAHTLDKCEGHIEANERIPQVFDMGIECLVCADDCFHGHKHGVYGIDDIVEW